MLFMHIYRSNLILLPLSSGYASLYRSNTKTIIESDNLLPFICYTRISTSDYSVLSFLNQIGWSLLFLSVLK